MLERAPGSLKLSSHLSLLKHPGVDIVLSLKEIKVGEVTKLAQSPTANGGIRNQIQLHPSP